MKSLQHHNDSKAATSKASDDKKPNRMRKRKLSEIAEDDEGRGPNYDILQCFPALLCRYVFSHLSGKEMLEMSTVSREWNNFIGERPQVRKLTLFFNEEKLALSRKAKNILLDSQRQYQNISVSTPSRFLLSFLAQRTGAWKSVKVITRKGIDQKSLPALLELIEPTVEELLVKVQHRQNEASTNFINWTFPHLKTLYWSIWSNNDVLKYIGRVTSLVKFGLYNRLDASPETIMNLQALLRNNSNLKEIIAMGGIWEVLENLPEVPFKLQKLAIFDLYEPSFVDPISTILKTHAETLELLNIRAELSQPLLKILLNMPKLTSLAVQSISNDIQELPVSKTITTLKVSGGDLPEVLIRAMPSLKHLKCSRIDDKHLHVLDQILPDLESIDVSSFNVSRIPEGQIFPKIMEFKARSFSESFQESSGNTNFTKLVERERERLLKNSQ